MPVIDWLQYDGLTFIVLPRWGDCVVAFCDLTAEQLLLYANTLLEGLVFLHENRIAHRDIALQNTVANVIGRDSTMSNKDAAILLHPSVARFAYIDFDAAVMLPMDTVIEDVVMTREMRIGISYLGLKKCLANPFKDDILVLLRTLQTYTRVLEEEIPQIGLFFDTYLKGLSPPPVGVVFDAFRKLRSELTTEQLGYVPKERLWKTEAQRLRDKLRLEKLMAKLKQGQRHGMVVGDAQKTSMRMVDASSNTATENVNG